MTLESLVLLGAVVGLVGSHLLLSHVLRRSLVGVLGTGGFHVLYGLVAAGLLLTMLITYQKVPHDFALWSSENAVLQIVFSVGSCLAAALFVASLFGNPGLLGANNIDLSTRIPHGVYLITRHPMMFAVAIGSVAQILINPTERNLIVFTGFAVLALAGSRLQDRRKIAQTGREWTGWVTRTRYWPNLRRAWLLGPAWPIGIVIWLIITWFESRTSSGPMGLWYFIARPS